MKAVITIDKNQFTNHRFFQNKVESLAKKKETSDQVEYYPKYKKASEMIKMLREEQITYQIRFVESI